MINKYLLFLGLVALSTSVATSALAEGMPSAKASMKMGEVAILNAGSTGGYKTIMSAAMKTSSQKDLLLGIALECGLMTRTKVSSKQGLTDSSSAAASVKVRVLIDGKAASPGEVVFCKRTQELSATLGGIMQECRDANLDGVISQLECTWLPEEIELVLNSMNANSFSFGASDVGVGIHKIEVQARIDSGASYQLGAADANASIGKGSLSIEEIRMVSGAAIDF